MKKKNFLIMLLMTGVLLWAGGRISAQSEESNSPQKSHDSTAVMEHRKKEVELSKQRKDAAKRFREMRARAVYDSASGAISSDTTFSDTTTDEGIEGGQTNE